MRRKAQIQSTQTIMIAVFMFLIIAIAMLFYFRVAKRSAGAKAEEVNVLKGLELVNQLQRMPEFSCPTFGAEINPCIDIVKAEAFKKLIEDDAGARIFYSSFLGNIRINVTAIYPEPQNIGEVFNLLTQTDSENVLAYQIPINVYNPVTDRKSFGAVYLEIGVGAT